MTLIFSCETGHLNSLFLLLYSQRHNMGTLVYVREGDFMWEALVEGKNRGVLVL